MERDQEAKLVRHAAAGDREACAELVRSHQERLYAFMLRVSGDREVAEEVTQEAFVRALRHLDRFDTSYRFSTWLFTIAQRVLWNMRDKMRPKASGDLIQELGAVSPPWTLAAWTAERAETSHRERDQLQAALMELSDLQREIIVLYHQQGWSVGRVAKFVRVPEGTVKSHLYRAREAMAASITRMEAEAAVEIHVRRMEHGRTGEHRRGSGERRS
jgi:RNA polymerase sigma-70 factor (ECF subfamily)